MVLVGAGHAHLQVLEACAEAAPPDVSLTVVVDQPVAVYSGMVPGAVAGDHPLEETVIPVAPLVAAAGGSLRTSPLVGVDPVGRRLFLGDGSTVEYQVASLNLGVVDGGQDTPGVPEHVVSARRADRLMEAARTRGGDPAVVVGGGAAGVELAAALAGLGSGPVTVVEAGDRLLPGRGDSVAGAVRKALEKRGVEVLLGRAVREVGTGTVVLADGAELPAGLVVWAVGAAPPPLLADTPLPLDGDGYLRVRSTLQVVGHPDLFAAGSCASVEGEDLANAGVHAVRQGPVLAGNLEARLSGRRVDPYRPPSDILTLLNLGDGRALGTKWGFSLSGRWVHALKTRIDRRWVGRFRR